MMIRSNKQYANIQTMSELRSARERLAWEIESSERAIDRQYDGLRDMFTLSYLSTVVMRKIESVRAWISTIYDGYRLAMSLFTRNEEPVVEPVSESVVEQSKAVYSQGDTVQNTSCNTQKE